MVKEAGRNGPSESDLAWHLSGNLVEISESGNRVDRPSLASHEENPGVESDRQRRELEAYVQSADPLLVQDVMGQYHTTTTTQAPYRRSAPSNDIPNADMTADSCDFPWEHTDLDVWRDRHNEAVRKSLSENDN